MSTDHEPLKREVKGPLNLMYLVFGVCAVTLLALLDPLTIFTSRRYRSGAAGISNAKQQAIALMLYGGDNNDYLPHRDRWMSVAIPYAKSEGVFRDPVDTKIPSNHNGFALASDASLANFAEFPAPTTTPLTFRSYNFAINASDPMHSPRPDDAGKAWVSWVDGHASKMRVAQHGALKKP